MARLKFVFLQCSIQHTPPVRLSLSPVLKLDKYTVLWLQSGSVGQLQRNLQHNRHTMQYFAYVLYLRHHYLSIVSDHYLQRLNVGLPMHALV